MKKLPKVGGIYNHYDDGKIKESRLMKSLITCIQKYDVSSLTDDEREDLNWCDFLYSQNTDYLIEADLYIDDNEIEKIKYIRTLDGEWFSLGWWAGILDVDNSLTLDLKKYYKEEGIEISDYYTEL